MTKNNLLAALFGVVALGALFFKLPGIPDLFGMTCKSCTASSPYFPMLAAAYFAFLISFILSFPTFPSFSKALGGLFWALGLLVTLTYISPEWCSICLIAHACHISMWMILIWSSKYKKPQKENLFGMKLSLIFTAPIAIMALFSTLNFSFLIYGIKTHKPANTLVKVGETIKPFQLNISEKNLLSKDLFSSYEGVVLNFISPNCSYCKQQIPKLNEISKEYSEKGFFFVNVSSEKVSELLEHGQNLEWAEDSKGEVSSLFGITGFPTTVLLDAKGKVLNTTMGASNNFEKDLKNKLNQVQLNI